MAQVIPRDPAEFFERFFPAQFAEHRQRFPSHDSPGAAVFEIAGDGSWAVKVAGGDLCVCRGKPPDTLLQISISRADFTAIFVERTQREVDARGALSESSLDAFKPLFVDDHKAATIAGAVGSTLATLAFHIDHDGATRQMFITPGPGEQTPPRATVSMKLDDFLAMQSGHRSPPGLFFRRRLRVSGDFIYAVRMSAILG